MSGDLALHNIEAEQALLGVLLVNNDACDRVMAIVRAEDFHDPVHARIFAAVLDHVRDGRIASPVTLKPLFADDPGLEPLGGIAYLVRLAGAAISLFAVTDYARQVADLSRRRDLAAVIDEAKATVADLTRAPEAAAAVVESWSLAQQERGDGKVISFMAAATVALRQANVVFETGQLPGIRSGIGALDDMIGGFGPGQMVVVAGRPGMGKAQPLDAPVLLASGEWRQMGDLKFGDRLASVDGGPSVVVAVHNRGVLPAFRVTFSDGRSTLVAADHLWRVRSRHWPTERVVDTGELSRLLTAKRHQGRLSIDLVSGDFGSPGALPVEPYLLGAILGDGSTLSGGVRLTSADQELVDAVAERLPATMQIKRVVGSHAYSVCNVVRGGQTPLTAGLRDLGLMGVRGESKRVPAVYLRADRATRLDLLRGLMDTDGWSEKEGAVRFCSTSQGLAEDVAYLVRSLGGLASIRSKTPTCGTTAGGKVEGKTAYVVKIRHPHPESLFRLDRKAARCRRGHNASVRLTVKAVEPEGSAPMRCITVSHPSSLYVTDDFIVTHNSAVSLQFGLNVARRGHGVGFASLEMSEAELAFRAFAEDAARSGQRIPYQDMRLGRLSDEEFEKLTWSARNVADLPIRILPADVRSPGAIFGACQRVAKRFEKDGKRLDLIIVDYLQIMEASSRGNANERVAEMSLAMKAMARRLNVPVVVLAQLSRAVESRDDKRPTLSDLRDSGAIEQDADIVIFPFREEYYLRRQRPDDGDPERMQKWQTAISRCAGQMDLIVAKQRMGPTGTACAIFDETTNWLRDTAGYQYARRDDRGRAAQTEGFS